MEKIEFHKIEEAVSDLKKGKMIRAVDDEDRENEGDLICAADHATPENINFMISKGKGLVCVPMRPERLDELGLSQMVETNDDPLQTAFTISVDHISTSTGISAFERSETIKKLADAKCSLDDFKKPGHIFPLRARPKGVLERPGHTEAAIDLVKLAELSEAAVICEIINEKGQMARLNELFHLSRLWDLKIICIKDLICYMKEMN